MNVLLLGASGQVGKAFLAMRPIKSWNRNQVDLLDLVKTKAALEEEFKTENNIDCIINAAAFTQVDLAEKEQKNAETLNAGLPALLSEFCFEKKIKLIHFSSDYVYSGEGDQPFFEPVTEFDNSKSSLKDFCKPLNFYGESKLRGDQAIEKSGCEYMILRTSWVYAPEGKNFVNTILRLAAEKETLSIVNDQIGSPTYAPDSAKIALQMLSQFKTGIYHVTNSGYCSWADFADAILEEALLLNVKTKVKNVIRIASSEYPTPAKRPKSSRLSLQKLQQVFSITPRPWREALHECIVNVYSEKQDRT